MIFKFAVKCFTVSVATKGKGFRNRIHPPFLMNPRLDKPIALG